MRRLLGAEADEFEASLTSAASIGLRVNTLKIPVEEFVRLSPWPLTPVPWCPTGFVVPTGERPALHPFHSAGLYYLQDPAAMAVAEALAPRPGEAILDLAAAPGGKSTHLAAASGDEGLLIANDVHGGRARELSRNLERWGPRSALVLNETPDRLARHWPERFDAVLLDAPCSGEGMFRKNPDAAFHWSEEAVAACASRQRTLLEDAASMVRPGGRLVYSTCTFGPRENEQVVQRFLALNPNWQLLDLDLPGVAHGRPDWAPGPGSADLVRAVRLWPHLQPGEGHFVAVLRRGGVSDLDESRRVATRPETSAKGARKETQVLELWERFKREDLAVDPVPEHPLLVRRDGLYAVPPAAPDVTGLRVLRPGVWLGTDLRGRFAPSHSLALTLQADEAARSVDLQPDDPDLVRYLSGAELERPGEDGWTLITVAGHPLGWGRRARNIIKNHYPKGLRRQSA